MAERLCFEAHNDLINTLLFLPDLYGTRNLPERREPFCHYQKRCLLLSREDSSTEPFTVEYDEKEDEYVIEGPKIERMLGYTNLESEKGFVFFQNFMKENGILEMLEELGIQDGDTVRIYGHSFDYYK